MPHFVPGSPCSVDLFHVLVPNLFQEDGQAEPVQQCSSVVFVVIDDEIGDGYYYI